MTAARSRRLLSLPLLSLLSALLLLAACARVARDELPRVVPPSGGPTGVAMPSLRAPSPAPCAVPPPDPLTASAGNRYDDAAAERVRQYLDAHPDEAGALIVNVGRGLYAGFVADWCRHREALQQLAGRGTPVDVFAVVQSNRAGQRLADRTFGATDALGRAGIQIGTAGVDPGTGLTSVTTPNDPAEARAVILRELELPPDAPIAVSHGDLPIPVPGRTT